MILMLPTLIIVCLYFSGTKLHILFCFYMIRTDFPTIINDIDDNLIGEEGKSRLRNREIYRNL